MPFPSIISLWGGDNPSVKDVNKGSFGGKNANNGIANTNGSHDETTAVFFKQARANRFESIPSFKEFEPHLWFDEHEDYLMFADFALAYHLATVHVDLQWAKACSGKDKAIKTWKQFNKESIEGRPFPWFLSTVILLCVLIHCYRSWISEEELSVGSDSILQAFALIGYGEQVQAHREYYRLFTATFLHFDNFHLASNVVGILMFSKLEQIHGSVVVGIIFAVSAVAASMTHAVLSVSDSTGLACGLSGAVYGLDGALYADAWTNWDLLMADTSEYLSLVTIGSMLFRVKLEVMAALWWDMVGERGTGHAAHSGGFIFGFCLSLPLLKRSRNWDISIDNQRGRVFNWMRFLCSFGAVSLLFFMTWHIWGHADSGSPRLSWCPNCFEFPESWRHPKTVLADPSLCIPLIYLMQGYVNIFFFEHILQLKQRPRTFSSFNGHKLKLATVTICWFLWLKRLFNYMSKAG